MPLSSNGLCDAEITVPSDTSLRAGDVGHGRCRQHPAGCDRGAGQPVNVVRPALAPIHSPDSRVSRPMSRRGAARQTCREHRRRWPRRAAGPSPGSRGHWPATPAHAVCAEEARGPISGWVRSRLARRDAGHRDVAGGLETHGKIVASGRRGRSGPRKTSRASASRRPPTADAGPRTMALTPSWASTPPDGHLPARECPHGHPVDRALNEAPAAASTVTTPLPGRAAARSDRAVHRHRVLHGAGLARDVDRLGGRFA